MLRPAWQRFYPCLIGGSFKRGLSHKLDLSRCHVVISIIRISQSPPLGIFNFLKSWQVLLQEPAYAWFHDPG